MLVLAIISTGSRMGLALCLLGSLGGVAAYKAAGWRLLPARPVFRLAMASAVVLALAAVGLAAARSGALERLAHTNRVSETRVAMLEPLLATARAFMPFGSGFGSFDSVFRRFEPNSLLSTIYMNQAHNEPMQLAIEGGLPALLLLAAFAGWWLWSAVKLACRREPSGGKALTVGWIAATAILMASSLVDYPLRTPLLSAVFAVACVEIAARKRIAEPRGREAGALAQGIA